MTDCGFGGGTFGSGNFGDACAGTGPPPPTGNDYLVGVNTVSRDGFMFYGQTVQLDNTDPDWASMLTHSFVVTTADNALPDPFVYPPT